MVYPITKFWFYPLNWLMVKKIKGMNNIPKKTPFIVVSNHEKLVDPLYILYSMLRKLDRKVHFIASTRWWFLGDGVCRKWAGCIPLFNSKQAYEEAKKLLKSGEIVGVFPEGHLYKKVRAPKSGALRLAIETKTPLLPIGIKSSYFPFGSKVNIGKLIYINNKDKNIEKQTLELMAHVYKLRNYDD